MAKVLGVGGIFFRSKNGAALAQWYATALGFEIDTSFGGTTFAPANQPPGGYTVWSPFAEDTTYFGPDGQTYMINLIVDDVPGALEQVAAAGGSVAGEIEELEFGVFGWFTDPDANRVELWQPAPP